MNNLDNPRWTDEEDDFLKDNFNKSYQQLSKEMNRSIRAIKHRVGFLELKRDERRKWDEKELQILKDNPNLSAKELAIKVGRSEFQVAQWLRKMRGSANRRFKVGWDIPSKDLAYFLGALMSDGTISKYSMAITVKEEDMEFSERVRRFIEDVIGLEMTERFVEVNLKNRIGKYRRLWSSSNQYAKNFGFHGAKSDWVVHLEKFKWIWDDPWFWSFLGGFYDGDGCLKIRDIGGSKDYPIVEFAVKPILSREKIIDELNGRGWEVGEFSQKGEIVGFELRGGRSETERFLNAMDSSLARKKL